MILALLDSGLRRAEYRRCEYEQWQLFVRKGKGNKQRTTFFGNKYLREITRYLRHWDNVIKDAPLWSTQNGERLSADGPPALRGNRDRGAWAALLSPHVRFAISTERLRHLQPDENDGPREPETLQRYIKQTHEDIARAHAQSSPADKI